MYRSLLFLVLLLPAVCNAELVISDAWIKNLPPAVPVRAAYMTLHNSSTKALRIVALRSASFARVEIHETVMQDGMMRMQQVPELRLNPGQGVQLAPGGLHLMLIEPTRPTRPGEMHTIEIEYDDGSRQSLQIVVKK